MPGREVFRLFRTGTCVTASLLLLAGQLWVGVLLWTLVSLLVAHEVVTVARKKGFGSRLGTWATIRLILIVGIAGPLVHHHGISQEWAAWLGLGLAMLAVRSEPLVARASGYQGLQVANLVGWGAGRESTSLHHVLAALEFLSIPVLMVFAIVGVPGWVWPLVLTPSAAIAIIIGLQARARHTRTRDADTWVPEMMTQLAPKFVLYWDAPSGTAYQIGMWIPFLKRVGQPFFVMVRNPSTFTQAVSVCEDVPVILCRTMADMDRCVPETLTTAFYVNNGAKNAHFVRYPQLTHVQLLHGDSDKASSFNPITVMFDKIYVAGQAGINRYADHGVDIPAHKFEIVGRPQVEGVRAADGRLADIPNPRILYAPTWRGNYSDASYSSLPQAEVLFEELLARGCSIVFRPHPYCRKDPEFREIIKKLNARLAQHTGQTGVEHVYGAAAEIEMSVVDCFNSSDAMISDVSSVVVDYLHSEKPFALIAAGRTSASFIEEFPLAVAAYVLSGRAETWALLMDKMFGEDPLAETRRKLRVHYLGDFERDTYSDGFVSAAATQVERRKTLPTAPRVRW